MTKKELIRKRRSDALRGVRDALAVLKASRRQIASIMRPWRVAIRRVSRAVDRLERLESTGGFSATIPGASEPEALLEGLLGAVEEEHQALIDISHAIQGRTLSTEGEDALRALQSETAPARVRIVPAADRPGIEGKGYYVESPVGRVYRETIEMARLTAKLQAKAHGTTVEEK